MIKQRTIRDTVSTTGVGLHCGTRVTLTLRFNAPYINQPITSITVSGLLFAASLQQQPPAADCSVSSPTSFPADSVTFDAVAKQLRMSFAGLPSGTAGLQLAVTCRITNFVNAPASSSATFSVSIVAFGDDSAPLYTQSGEVSWHCVAEPGIE